MVLCCFFFKDPATTEIYTYCHPLSLHDALPISSRPRKGERPRADLGGAALDSRPRSAQHLVVDQIGAVLGRLDRVGDRDHALIVVEHPADIAIFRRSEEHTSELQSLMRISYAVFCLKKKKKHTHRT